MRQGAGSQSLVGLNKCRDLCKLGDLEELGRGVLSADSLLLDGDRLGQDAGHLLDAPFNVGECVLGVVLEVLRPGLGAGAHDSVSEVDGRSCDLRRLESAHVVRRDRELHQVLGQVVRLLVSRRCLGVPSKEVQREGAAQVVVERLEKETLHRDDLLLCVRVVGDPHKVADLRWVHLLVLGRHEHRGDAGELELGAGDVLQGEESVNEVERHVQRFLLQLETDVHFDQPVDQDPSHVWCDVGLDSCHVPMRHSLLHLELLLVRHDLGDVLGHDLRIVGVNQIDIGHASRQYFFDRLDRGRFDVHWCRLFDHRSLCHRALWADIEIARLEALCLLLASQWFLGDVANVGECVPLGGRLALQHSGLCCVLIVVEGHRVP
eukprot:m.26605 g.26605  ORF g.26605 m.26605 type:complete len:377 (+) comp11810_c0_seq1:154-1284(+)